MEDNTQPQTISYKLQQCIGQGLNSRVYRALREDAGLHIRQPVAIKILNSENLVEIWKKEFLSLSKVRSQHCVSVLGFDWIERQPALVLELVEGLNLGELTQDVDLTLDEISELAAQIRQGLEDLQAVGLSHGDLSLNNIMIDEQGRVVLLDFGLGNFSDTSTQTTVEFAAPEIIAGGKPNLRTDTYALQKIIERISYGKDVSIAMQAASQPLRREKLGQKVSTLRLKRNQSPQTVPLARPTRASKKIVGFRVAALLLLLTFGLSLRGEAWPDVRPSRLTVRTDKWVVVAVNGQNIGYAPFESRAVAAGKVEIDFRHSRGAGHRTLTIRKGQHIVLGNSFFGL